MSNIKPGDKVLSSTHDEEFDAYDNLPPRMRAVVAAAAHNFSAPFIAGMLKDGFTEDQVIEAIRTSRPGAA